MSDYAKILRYYYDTLTEEEFQEKTHEWALRYIRYMKEREEKEETVHKVIFILLRSKQEFDQDHQVSVYG